MTLSHIVLIIKQHLLPNFHTIKCSHWYAVTYSELLLSNSVGVSLSKHAFVLATELYLYKTLEKSFEQMYIARTVDETSLLGSSKGFPQCNHDYLCHAQNVRTYMNTLNIMHDQCVLQHLQNYEPFANHLHWWESSKGKGTTKAPCKYFLQEQSFLQEMQRHICVPIYPTTFKHE